MSASYPLGDVPVQVGISEEEANYLLALVSNDIARGATWSEQDHRGLADDLRAKLWAVMYPDRCPNCGIGSWYEECVFCVTFGAHDGECHHHRPFAGHECEQTPCIVCGAPLLAGVGHDAGCMVASPNHYSVEVDGVPMASGPGDTAQAERMRDAYRTINPDADVTISHRRCDDNPCAAHKAGRS